MKKITLLTILTLIFFGYSRPAVAEIPRVINPNLDKIIVLPSATPTPTTALKFKIPNKEFLPLVTSGTSPTVAQLTPTPTGSPNTPTPDITTDSSPAAEGTVNPVIETVTVTPAEPEETGTDENNTKNVVILVLVSVILAIIVISQWPKIKDWLHRKTE